MAWSNSVRYGADDEHARLRVHPDDALAAGVGDGDAAVVVSEHGAVDVTVVVDERIHAGVLSLVHGRRGHSPGNLTSSVVDVDPLTTMPRRVGSAGTDRGANRASVACVAMSDETDAGDGAATLDPAQLAELAPYGDEIAVDAGDVLFSPADQTYDFWVVLAG